MRALRSILTLVTLAGAATGSPALTFNYTWVAGTTAAEQAAFQTAGALWSSVLQDPITVNLTLGTGSLDPGVLANTNSTQFSYSYTSFKTALGNDRLSADDFNAVSHLAAGASFPLLINRTSDNPNGAGSATPYLDSAGANNQTIRITSANARAVGLSAPTSTDGSITFSNSFVYDLNPADGITPGQFDFVGLATHEIGHALGFISGVDVLDTTTGLTANGYPVVSALDLFRYSSQSFAQGAIDWTADNRVKYFSLDGGVTAGPTFANGVVNGDGRQASHWKDDLGLGVMDPTAAPGELLVISTNDKRALDVIGWNLAAVPEPATWMMWALGLGVFLGRRRI